MLFVCVCVCVFVCACVCVACVRASARRVCVRARAMRTVHVCCALLWCVRGLFTFVCGVVCVRGCVYVCVAVCVCVQRRTRGAEYDHFMREVLLTLHDRFPGAGLHPPPPIPPTYRRGCTHARTHSESDNERERARESDKERENKERGRQSEGEGEPRGGERESKEGVIECVCVYVCV